MVISPLKFTRSADLRGPFGRVKVKDAFPLDALTIKLLILPSCHIRKQKDVKREKELHGTTDCNLQEEIIAECCCY